MIHFYKPNKWNTGCCCSFSFNTSDNSFYLQLLKQLSWDEKLQRGKFDTESKSICKLAPNEIGSIIDTIESGREFKNFHKNPKENTSFSFKPKMKENQKTGFNFSLTKTPVSGEKKSYSMNFDFGESKLLKQYLSTGLSMYSQAAIKKNNEAIIKSMAQKKIYK